MGTRRVSDIPAGDPRDVLLARQPAGWSSVQSPLYGKHIMVIGDIIAYRSFVDALRSEKGASAEVFYGDPEYKSGHMIKSGAQAIGTGILHAQPDKRPGKVRLLLSILFLVASVIVVPQTGLKDLSLRIDETRATSGVRESAAQAFALRVKQARLKAL